MQSLHTFLADDDRKYQWNDKAVNEIIYRLPAAIGPLSFISHVPFIHISEEDSVYYRLVESLKTEEWFIDIVRNEIISLAIDQWKAQTRARARDVSEIQAKILDAFRAIKVHYPWFIICGSVPQITLLVTKLTLAEVGRSRLIICQEALSYLYGLIGNKWPFIESKIINLVESYGPHLSEIHDPKVGGLISILEKEQNIVSVPPTLTFGDDHLVLDITPAGVFEGFHSELRWSRANQYWNYTKLEEYGLPKITEHDLNEFLGHLLCTSWGWSPLKMPLPGAEAPGLEAPGRFFGGAHYVIFPLSVLIAILHDPSILWSLQVRAAIERGHPEHLIKLEALEARAASDQQFNEYRQDIISQLQVFLERSLPFISGSPLERINQLQTYCKDLLHVTLNNQIKRSHLNKIISDMCVAMWHFLYKEELSRTIGGIDYVSCSVMDQRGMYFSNFRPMDELGFTRTFFIDLELTDKQRGRLVSALCDIATYRFMCVRDIERVRAILSGIDHKSRQFHSYSDFPLQTSESDINVKDQRRKDVSLERQQIAELRTRLRNFNELLSTLALLNRVITNGITGKTLSANDYLRMIRRRGDDIRQERVEGYALLRDFLERGVTQSVQEVRRMADRYNSLRTIIEEALGRIRTELNAIEAATVLEVMQEAAEYIDNLRRLSEASVEHIGVISQTYGEQIRLARAADILAWIAGTYYASQIFEKFDLSDAITQWIRSKQPSGSWLVDYGGTLTALICSIAVVVLARISYGVIGRGIVLRVKQWFTRG